MNASRRGNLFRLLFGTPRRALLWAVAVSAALLAALTSAPWAREMLTIILIASASLSPFAIVAKAYPTSQSSSLLGSWPTGRGPAMR